MHPGKTEKSDLHAIVHVNLDHIPIQDDDDKAHSPPSTALPSNSTSPEEGGGEGEGGLFSPNDGNQMYLGLKAKLTRAFSSTATFTLLFIAVQILRLAQSSVPETAANFKQKLLDSCTAVDVGLNTLATQVPAHLAVTTSRLAVKAIQSSIRQTAALVSVAIQVLNWIVLFVLSRYKKVGGLEREGGVGGGVGGVGDRHFDWRVY